MLGHTLVTKQTGPEGKLVNKVDNNNWDNSSFIQVLIAKRHFLRRETYIAIMLDRGFGGPVFVGCAQGGVDIEKIAHETPSMIIKATHAIFLANLLKRNLLTLIKGHHLTKPRKLLVLLVLLNNEFPLFSSNCPIYTNFLLKRIVPWLKSILLLKHLITKVQSLCNLLIHNC